MRNIKWIFCLFLLVVAGFWIGFHPDFWAQDNIILLRNQFLQLTGLIAISSMSLILVLATRPKWLEPWLGGLDKTYRLHKWLGITALVMAVTHWLWIEAPKWARDLGLIEISRPPRPSREGMGALQQFLMSQKHLAEGIGEWSFYAAVALMVVALVKLVPYRWFVKTHKLIAIAYLALVFHAAVLFNFDDWVTPSGMILGVLLLAGAYSAVLVLTNRVGRRSTITATLEKIETFPTMQSVEVTVNVGQQWPGHRAGQFAFVTFDDKEGAHPFTIASAWNPSDGRLKILIKALGDYTSTLHSRLKPGSTARVEGPYGGFTFDDADARQVWIGGGIGITPFLARLKDLAQLPAGAARRNIDLYHAVPVEDEKLSLRLKYLAHRAGINLHIIVDSRDGLLTGEQVRKDVADWKSASFWFCGPRDFGTALSRDLTGNGLPDTRFHQELFEFR